MAIIYLTRLKKSITQFIEMFIKVNHFGAK
jgi:hypothetical protein